MYKKILFVLLFLLRAVVRFYSGIDKPFVCHLRLKHLPFNRNKHQRKSIRLKGYDYSQAGLYFVTICVQNRLCLFGDIVNGKMILNDAGKR